MKTAMQQAIELVKKYDNREIPMKVLLYNLELLQEKEKEQIHNDFKAGMGYEDFSVPPNFNNEWEEYYNQNYNQNK